LSAGRLLALRMFGSRLLETRLLGLRIAVYALLAVSIVAFFLVGADGPARPYLTNTYLPGWPHQGASHP